jgi:hypothetical protein
VGGAVVLAGVLVWFFLESSPAVRSPAELAPERAP